MSLAWRLNRLRAMSAREIGHRVGQRVRMHLERAGLDGAARYRAPAERAGSPWVAPLPCGFDADVYAAAASRILLGRFDLFALQDADLGFPPEWNRDPKTGTVAPLTFGKLLDYRDERLVGDIKYLWELNRHLELVTLAQAWHLTRRPQYAQGCRSLLTSWLDACPYPRGPNWTSSLEHGVRLVNWSFAWHLLGGSGSWLFAGPEGARFRTRWLESVYRHCHFISGHLSRHSSANNHLLGELLGLFAGAVTWPAWPQSRRWQQLARRELERESLRQTGPDGVNREQATWYHHAVADTMLLAALIGRANGCELGREFWRRLEAMLEFIASIMDVAGNVPAIGDSDDSRLVRLCPARELCVYRSLLATGAILFDRADFKRKARVCDDKTRWLLGDAAAARFESIAGGGAGAPCRRSFPDGGYYVLGSGFGTPREVRIVADAGPLGYLSIAAHGHADALSFTLAAGGREVLVDPGTFAYHTRAAWRQYFRGTAAHNTVRIDGQDQSVSGGSFLWLVHADARCELFTTDEAGDHLIASHEGYRRLDDPVVHRREWRYDPSAPALTVCDELLCRAAHRVEMFWHFAEACEVAHRDGEIVATTGDVTVALALPVGLACELARGRDEPPAGWISRRYDERVPCVTAVASGEIRGHTRLRTRITVSHGR